MCVLDKSEDGNVSCPKCRASLRKLLKLECEPVYIFVDASNVWTEVKKKVARELRLKSSEDPRVRIHAGKLSDVVSQGRPLARGKLYGSEPPPIYSAWEKIKENKFEVEVFEKSTVTGKEKQVDQQLVADITETVCEYSVYKGIIAIVCGDADVLPAIRKTIKKGWKCEVWFWEQCGAQAIKKMEKENPQAMKVVFLDNYTKEIAFNSYQLDPKYFDSEIQQTSVVIVKANDVIDTLELTNSTDWQDELSTYLERPFQYFFTGKEHSFNDLVLVFRKLGSEVEFDEITSKLCRRYGERVKPYVSYCNSIQPSEIISQAETMVSNRFHVLQSELLEGSALITDASEGRATAIEEAPLNDGFQIVSNRKKMANRGSRSHQQYSKPCPERAYCKKTYCSYFHTKEERQFFRSRRKKCSPCFNGSNCKKEECVFAHNENDSFCCVCSKWGHLQGKAKKEKCFPKKASKQ